jgi:vitamin K-dependent gamma-carboxylase
MRRLLQPVDLASLAAFRIAFGAVMVATIVRYFLKGWIHSYYVAPSFYFTFPGFGWVKPLPALGMYVLFVALGLLAAGVMVGLFYRACVLLFAVGFTYVQLLDRTHYLNHYYLTCLLAFLMVVMPLEGRWSLDSLRRPERRRDTVPAWCLWALRAQLAGVYLFSGVAKLQPDWLLRAQPMEQWLDGMPVARWLAPAVPLHSLALAASWGGMLVVLLGPPLMLLSRRARPYAYAALLLFHLSTGLLLNIGVFPWLAALALLLFFEPDWPRTVLARLHGVAPPVAAEPQASARAPRLAPWLAVLLCAHFAVQVLLPLRHWLYPGPVIWNEEGFLFSWHLKIMEKRANARFEATDPASGERWEVDPLLYLTEKQAYRMVTHPDMLAAFARHVSAEHRRQGRPGVEVRAFVAVKLNGRPRRLLVDPAVDLAAHEERLGPRPWILPLEGPGARLVAPGDQRYSPTQAARP